MPTLDDDPQFTDQDGDPPKRAGAWNKEWTSCPVALASKPWLGHGLKAWTHWKAGSLSSIEPTPSAALIDLIGLIDRESNLLQNRKSEDRHKDAGRK